VTWRFTLRDQGKELVDGVPGPFCAREVNLSGGQAGRSDGYAESHRFAIGDEHDRGAARLAADREDGEAAPEEGMGRVGYLDLLRERLRWVVDRGIMKGSRSTIWITATCGRFSDFGYVTVCCCA
jgi:hypothetical protein